MNMVLSIMGTLVLLTIVFVGWGRYDSDLLRIIDASRRQELVGSTIDTLQPKVTKRLETCTTTEEETILSACKEYFGKDSEHIYFLTEGTKDYYLETRQGRITKVDILKP